MRGCIKTIKWCAELSLLFLVLTYVTSVNAEVHFVGWNTIWISNNFIITLFGGIFASLVAVDLCELRKYMSEKLNTENYLFYQSFYLYQLLMQMRINSEDCFARPEWSIADNFYDEFVRLIAIQMNAIRNTDYATFKHGKDSLMVVHERFRRETVQKISPVLQSAARLKIAYNETRIEQIQKQIDNKEYSGLIAQVTSACPRVSAVLKEEIESIGFYIVLVDEYITALDDKCKGRFGWSNIKGTLEFKHLEG